MLPEYTIIRLNEDSIKYFDFNKEYKDNLWFKTVYDLKMWAYVSDYIRVKTIYDHGGIYLDTDVTIYRKFDILLNNKMFIGNTQNNIPELAVFGAQRHNPILKSMYDFYKNDIWTSEFYIIGQILKHILQNKFDIKFSNRQISTYDNLTIYPYDYFYPYHYASPFTHECLTENTFTVHWGNSSWATKKNIFFLANKHKLPLKILLHKLDFIEKHDKTSVDKIFFTDLV